MEPKRYRYLSPLDRILTRLHSFFFVKHPIPTVLVNFVIYFLVILFSGEILGVSSNYFIILPVIAISLSWGFWGGFLAGLLGLPLNLALYYFLGHPEFSPESKIIAEISGILFGITLGYLSDYFNKMNVEIIRRKQSQKELEVSLKDKEILLKEIHHRVKNNLNLIKSLMQLQSHRIQNSEVHEACDNLGRRIYSISLVQDLLYSQEFTGKLDLGIYLKKLSESIVQGLGDHEVYLDFQRDPVSVEIDSKKLSSLGLVVNEALTNAIKYGCKGQDNPMISLEIRRLDKTVTVRISDNGPGFPADKSEEGLGCKLMVSLVESLKGEISFGNHKEGGEVLFSFPLI